MTEFRELIPFQDNLGNQIAFGDDTVMRQGTIKIGETGAKIRFGNRVTLTTCKIDVGKNSILEIGDDCQFTGEINVGTFSRVIIGKELTVAHNLRLKAVEGTSIIIGNDCLVGSDVFIRTNEEHPIYDVRTRKRLNPSRSISIGNHVWLDDDVSVLKGVIIGNASIVGARSVVTKDVPSNAICAGQPAMLIREGVTWERDVHTVTEEFYM